VQSVFKIVKVSVIVNCGFAVMYHLTFFIIILRLPRRRRGMMRPASMGAREQYFRKLRAATFMVSSLYFHEE